jgi:hypothetical protein
VEHPGGDIGWEQNMWAREAGHYKRRSPGREQNTTEEHTGAINLDKVAYEEDSKRHLYKQLTRFCLAIPLKLWSLQVSG